MGRILRFVSKQQQQQQEKTPAVRQNLNKFAVDLSAEQVIQIISSTLTDAEKEAFRKELDESSEPE